MVFDQWQLNVLQGKYSYHYCRSAPRLPFYAMHTCIHTVSGTHQPVDTYTVTHHLLRCNDPGTPASARPGSLTSPDRRCFRGGAGEPERQHRLRAAAGPAAPRLQPPGRLLLVLRDIRQSGGSPLPPRPPPAQHTHRRRHIRSRPRLLANNPIVVYFRAAVVAASAPVRVSTDGTSRVLSTDERWRAMAGDGGR